MAMDTFGNPKEEKEIFPVLFFVGGENLHYTCAMTTTSRECDVHYPPKGTGYYHQLHCFEHLMARYIRMLIMRYASRTEITLTPVFALHFLAPG